MRVLVTGGTGFVGAHSVAALLSGGHDVTLLARSPASVGPALRAVGVASADVSCVAGDMTDHRAVSMALEGVEAVLHAAAAVSLRGRDGRRLGWANPAGVANVVGEAARRRIDPIVYVSSAAALFEPGCLTVHADREPSTGGVTYAGSKRTAERVARSYQGRGAPVTITYPGAVLGPPAGTASGLAARGVAAHLVSGCVPLASGGWSMIDVRDLATVHLRCMRSGQGPRRFMCGGTFMGAAEIAQAYRSLTGRRIPVLPVPPELLRRVGRLLDRASGFLPIDSVFTEEAQWLFTNWVPTDDGQTTAALAVGWRSPDETLRDTILGLWEAGQLKTRHIGRMAEHRSPAGLHQPATNSA